MKKNIFILLLTALLMTGGCEKKSDTELLTEDALIQPITEEEYADLGTTSSFETDNSTQRESEVSEGKSYGDSAASGEETVKSGGEETAKHEEDHADQAEGQKAVYDSVLKNLYETYTLPDGRNLGYDENMDLSNNKFAIYDIDRDGKDELIILWTTTITAGMAQIVYGYDSGTGKVREELFEYPMQTFYDNGVVEAGLSHNHGLAGSDIDFWPYTLYRYDPDKDVYTAAAEVDAWSKEFREEDFDGIPFPDDIDTDGDGIVYKITEGNDVKLMDLGEYEKWQNSFREGAEKIEIPFQEIKESY